MRSATLLALLIVAGHAAGQTSNGRAGKGALSAEEQSLALKNVQEYARTYTASLPNYTCTQSTREVMTRPVRPGPGGPGLPLGIELIEEQLSFVNGRESRTVTKINNARPSPKEQAHAGTISHGEFGNLLDTIFSPKTRAEIHWDHATTLEGRRVNAFAYRVPQASGYALVQAKGYMQVPFEGLVYADSQTGAVVRIEMKCIEIPAKSEYRSLELTLDYKPTKVADKQYLLPFSFRLHYEMIGNGEVVAAEYKSYRRFSAESTLKFNGDVGDAAAAVAEPKPAPEIATNEVVIKEETVIAESPKPAPPEQPAAPPVIVAPVEAPKPAPPDQRVATTASAPDTVFRASSRLIQVSVIAQDKDGKPVTDLRRDEFQIFDNAAPQEIRLFLAEVADRSEPAPQAPGAFTNRIGSSGSSVLLFDRLFIDRDNNVFKHNVRARQKALQALKAIPQGDRIAIYSLWCSFQVVREFTSDRESLLAKLNAYTPGAAPCANPDIPGSDPGRPNEDPAAIAARMNSHEVEGYNYVAARRTADLGEYEFKIMADHLAGIPGRKNLIWVTSEFRLSPANVKRLIDANVAIYPVDAIGSMIGTPEAKKARYDPLRALAAMTGGVAFYDRDDFDHGIREAMRDGLSSYTLGFYSNSDATSAAVHHLGVRVSRPGVTLRYAMTYEVKPPPAVSAKPIDDLVQAMNRPVDATVIPVTAQATRNGDKVDLSVSIDAPSLDLELRDGLWKGEAELVMRFVTATGLPVGEVSAQTLKFSFRPATYEAMQKGGDPYRSHSELSIPAKAAELKVLVGNVATGKIGTLTIPLSEITSLPKK